MMFASQHAGCPSTQGGTLTSVFILALYATKNWLNVTVVFLLYHVLQFHVSTAVPRSTTRTTGLHHTAVLLYILFVATFNTTSVQSFNSSCTCVLFTSLRHIAIPESRVNNDPAVSSRKCTMILKGSYRAAEKARELMVDPKNSTFAWHVCSRSYEL
jgi:hypothetical protein